MAIVKKVAVPIYPAATFIPLKAVIDSLQLPYIVSTEIAEDDSQFTITFDTGAVWTYIRTSEDWNRFLKISYTVLGQTSTSGAIHTMNTTGESATVTICASPNIFYIKIYTSWRSAYLVGFYSVLEDDLAVTGANSSLGLSNLNLLSTQTAGAFSIPAVMNYSAGVNRIQYMNHAAVMSSGVKYYNINDIYSCTTITADTVLTFNGDNYYAVDSNLLIPIDPEQSNG